MRQLLAPLLAVSFFLWNCGESRPPVAPPQGGPTVSGTPMTVSVDFGKHLRPVSPLAFGSAEEAYAGTSTGDLDTDPVHYERMAALRLDQMRFNLMIADPRTPTGPYVCAALGCRGYEGDVPADGYLQKIVQMGARPVVTLIVVPGDLQRSIAMAVNAVNHYKRIGAPIPRWIIDNEPDLPTHGGVGRHTRELPPEEYSEYYNAMHDAMKAVDPSIQIGGPAISGLYEDYFRGFFARSASRLDFIDFHSYADYQATRDEARLLAETPLYEARIRRVRELFREVAPERADTIDIQQGEWNFDADPPDNDPRAFNGFTAVWGASVVGHILKAGGLSVSFANKDAELGLLFMDPAHGGNGNDPMPAYHGTGMFTGESLFRRFGSVLVETASSVPEVEVHASDNSRNIVLINKSATRYAAHVSLVGVQARAVDLWSIDKEHARALAPMKGERPPLSKVGFWVSLAPFSVTTAVVDP